MIHFRPPLAFAALLALYCSAQVWRRAFDAVSLANFDETAFGNTAVLVEAAVRNHVLKSKGIDAAQTFVDRQAHSMKRQRTW